jgi:hypothetical protein
LFCFLRIMTSFYFFAPFYHLYLTPHISVLFHTFYLIFLQVSQCNAIPPHQFRTLISISRRLLYLSYY